MKALVKAPVTVPAIRVNPTAKRVARWVRVSDNEFAPECLDLLESPPTPMLRSTVCLFVLMGVAVVAWGCLAGIDTVAVAQGRVQPSGRSKVVQPLEAGKVAEILVADGSVVKKGDPLILLDPTLATAERDAAAAALDSVHAEIARRRTEIRAIAAGTPCCPPIEFPHGVGNASKAREKKVMIADMAQVIANRNAMRAQIAEQVATKQRLAATVVARGQLVAVLQKRLDMKLALIRMGAGTRNDVLDAQQRMEQETTNVAYDQGQLAETDAAIVALQRKSDAADKSFLDDQAQKLEDARRKRDRFEQALVKAQAQLEHTRLAAPIDGTVQQLTVTTLGQVVKSGQPLLVLVPSSGAIEVEAYVLNKDIGDLAVGQDAVVKVDAFPFNHYGTLAGKVVRISHDAVEGTDSVPPDPATLDSRGRDLGALGTQNLVFPATIRLDKPVLTINHQQTRLTAGMTTSVEIITGNRRIIELLITPLHEAVSQAGHER